MQAELVENGTMNSPEFVWMVGEHRGFEFKRPSLGGEALEGYKGRFDPSRARDGGVGCNKSGLL